MSLREALQEIHDQYGYLTPALVLEEAREPSHPLHSSFDWDDTEAAQKWREYQAHKIIKVARIVHHKPEGDGEALRVRAFHRVPDNDGGFVYHPTDEIVSDPKRTEFVKRELEQEWKRVYDRAEAFRVYADEFVGDFADTVIKDARRLKRAKSGAR